MPKSRGFIRGHIETGFRLPDSFLENFEQDLDKKLFAAGLTTVYPGLRVGNRTATTGQNGVTFGRYNDSEMVVSSSVDVLLTDSDVAIAHRRAEFLTIRDGDNVVRNNTGFVLEHASFDSDSVDVFINGVLQPTPDYTVTFEGGDPATRTRVVFDTAPDSDDEIIIRIPQLIFRPRG